jgi:hypothetical protein
MGGVGPDNAFAYHMLRLARNYAPRMALGLAIALGIAVLLWAVVRGLSL